LHTDTGGVAVSVCRLLRTQRVGRDPDACLARLARGAAAPWELVGLCETQCAALDAMAELVRIFIIYISTSTSIYLSIGMHLSLYHSISLFLYLSIYFYLSIYLSIYPTIQLSIYLSIYLSISLSLSLSIPKLVSLCETLCAVLDKMAELLKVHNI